MSDYNTVTEWADYEGAAYGYNARGDEVIEVEALQDRAKCLKWNDPYSPGRAWHAIHEDGTTSHGRERNVTAARKAAQDALDLKVARASEAGLR